MFSFLKDLKLPILYFRFQTACRKRSAKYTFFGCLGYVYEAPAACNGGAKPAHIHISMAVSLGQSKTGHIKPASAVKVELGRTVNH